MNKGYISLFLVLSATFGISVSLYRFFEQNEYFIFLKREEILFESKRLVTKVCLSMIQEKVYAGVTREEVQEIHVSKKVFTDDMYCDVTKSDIQIENTTLVYRVNVETPLGSKTVVYTFKPGKIERSINSS